MTVGRVKKDSEAEWGELRLLLFSFLLLLLSLFYIDSLTSLWALTVLAQIYICPICPGSGLVVCHSTCSLPSSI